MASFNGLLQAEFHPPRNWKLTRPLSFYSEEINQEDITILNMIGVTLHSGGTIQVEEGFETNLASVPRALWGIMAPWDVARAAVIHDKLYSKCCDCYSYMARRNSAELQEVWPKARAVSDKVFLLAMKAAEPPVPRWKIHAAYRAVRIFGAKHARGKPTEMET